MLRIIGALLLAVLVVLGTALGTAPARFLDPLLSGATHGRLRLAEAQGSLWDGSGRLVFTANAVGTGGDASAAPEAGSGPQALDGLALPGRVRWNLRALPLLVGIVDATFGLDGMAQPVRLQGSFGELRLGPGRLALPSVELARLGSPWNSLRPSGALGLQWEPLVLREGRIDGTAAIELRDASSALTPVRPLGSYRVGVDGRGANAVLQLTTLDGPLQLSGDGTWDARGGLRFEARATAQGEDAERLRSFLGVIGRREGENTIIRIGA